jgi:hypothetical protein
VLLLLLLLLLSHLVAILEYGCKVVTLCWVHLTPMAQRIRIRVGTCGEYS